MAQMDLPVGAAFARLRGHAFAAGIELMHYLVDVSVELLGAAAAGLVLADGDV